ncbi:hypothetical protein B0J17DRAFT_722151 [Rhizoctonia solani]|nr:hypothetical protein B0J17DRAFT_722151 [Rhizoctonia solani]
MIEELRSMGDQLRTAWGNYLQVYSNPRNYHPQSEIDNTSGVSSGLSRQLDTELEFISLYESKVQEIKATIGRFRNRTSTLIPINTLPPEILICIFHLIPASPCNVEYLGAPRYKDQQFSKYPDYLAHVCTLWRRTAISSCSLWCHIDLSPYQSCYEALVSRAWVYAKRAGNLPIRLHIAESSYNRDFERAHEGYSDLYKLVSHISSRVETLEFVVGRYFRGFHVAVLRNLLLSEHPTLTKLVLSSEVQYYQSSISAGSVSPYMEAESDDLQLDITEDEMARGFAPLKVLHAHNTFPAWESNAYHGLVDLHLESPSNWTLITLGEPIAILQSSPGLLILHFGLQIGGLTSALGEIAPVCLQDLRVLKFFEDCPSSHHSELLRLIIPGSKPLQLCFIGHRETDAIFLTELESFFARSFVVKFYTQNMLPPMNILLLHAAHLECVVLTEFSSPGSWDEYPAPWTQTNNLGSLPRLRSLHILRSNLSEAELHLLADSCPNGTLVYACNVYATDDSHGERIRLDETELSQAFPTVTITKSSPYPSEDPTADWDILD